MADTTQEGFGFGLAVGALLGIAAALSAGLPVSTGASSGIAAGIITGLLTGNYLEQDRFAEPRRAIPFAMGVGTATGIVTGLLTAWSESLPYIDGFALGAGSGLVGGALIGLLAWGYRD